MLVFFHIILITLSNVLVQYPFEIHGYHTTYGAFTYPLIFILSDLASRFYGATAARKIIYQAMIPGLLISFLISSMTLKGPASFILSARVAIACFVAYVCGQLTDIFIFSKVKNTLHWALAPTISSSISNLVDTYAFFFLAFFQSSHRFMAEYWFNIACVDLAVKWTISVIAFIPLYGMALKLICKKKMPLAPN